MDHTAIEDTFKGLNAKPRLRKHRHVPPVVFNIPTDGSQTGHKWSKALASFLLLLLLLLTASVV
jgi:hypothetical protein